MELKFPWLIAGWLTLAVVAVALFPRVRSRPRLPASAIALAHTRRLEQIPRYVLLAKRHRRLMRLALACLLAGGMFAAVAASRPAGAATSAHRVSNRDVVLCLDVSSSMDEVDKAALRAFDRLIGGLSDDRVSLTVFNSVGLSVFPLANDYPALHDQIADVLAHPTDYQYSVLSGGKDYSSIGDGVTACLNQFGRLEKKRSRSLILATDNDSGASTVSLAQAGLIAKQSGIRVYSLDPNLPDLGGANSQGLVELSDVTGGEHFYLADASAVASVVSRINKQEKSKLVLPPVRRVTERPAPFILLALACMLAGYLVLWRVRE